MANSSNKNATKSLVMLIVTGVVLVAVTLCWFVINRKTTVDSLDSAVNNDASSTAKLYYGVDKNGDVAIKRSDTETTKGVVSGYEEFTDDVIKLENMVPGAEYFFKAEFTECKSEYKLSLILTEVKKAVENGLDVSLITVYKEITNGTDKVLYADGDETGEELKVGNYSVYKNAEIADYFVTGQPLIVYFSFKFSPDATVKDNMEKTINIGSVDVSIGSGTVAETTTAEETTVEETTVEETTVAE